jgi:CHAD domain-containing protein
MSDDARFFTVPRGATGRTVRRVLAAEFAVESAAGRSGRWVFLDTFDCRLQRAGLALVAHADALVLEDWNTGEALGSARRRDGDAPPKARDFAGSDLAARVPELIGARALLEVARATVREQELELSRRDAVVARVRVQSTLVRRRGSTRSVRALAVIPVAGGGRARHALRAAGDALTATGFRPSSRGFVERVLAATGTGSPPYFGRPRVTLPPDAPLRAVAAAVFAHLLEVMRRNEPGMRDDIDPEFLHDYRVALRRTRTGLSQFRGALTPEVAREYRARFARLVAATGRLRDLDVQLARHDEYANALPASLRRGFEPVSARMEGEREDAREALLGVLDHPSHARLMRDWRREVRGLAAGRKAGVASETRSADAGRALLRRRYGRLRRIARKTETFDDAALHRARIECKKVRYLLEFFAGVLGPGVDDAIVSLARVQNALGEYNDVAVQARQLSTLVRDDAGAGTDSPLMAAAIGAIIGALDARLVRLRSRCERRLASLGGRKSRRVFDGLLATK